MAGSSRWVFSLSSPFFACAWGWTQGGVGCGGFTGSRDVISSCETMDGRRVSHASCREPGLCVRLRRRPPLPDVTRPPSAFLPFCALRFLWLVTLLSLTLVLLVKT
ncbi:hypothetical protein B0H19DRAFT_1134450 [Mycena capillaripes]|nr:hypothetical protein B0H19DRAFT_1134450 [Mycena capillaripes]